jgi:hypothetical protein
MTPGTQMEADRGFKKNQNEQNNKLNKNKKKNKLKET